MHHIHAPTPAPHSPFTQLLTTPSSCPANRPPLKPLKTHISRSPYSTMKPHSSTDAGKQGSSYQKYYLLAAVVLPACGRGLVGSQSPPLVAPRGQKWHSSFACDTHSANVSERPSEFGGGSWGDKGASDGGT
jgi:hypothetical protein